jgi:Icc-related predicted phosphoesterase
MTKFRIESDLHAEFMGDYHSHCFSSRDWNSYTFLPEMEDDKEQILILAGDIIMIKYKERFWSFFKDISERFKEVILIDGNHSTYRYNFKTGYRDLKEFLREFKNIHLLENEVFEIDDFAIFGAVMWTNFSNRDKFAMDYAVGAMSDFQVIEYNAEDGSNKMHWTPELSVLEHENTIKHMTEFFKKYKNKRKIVVTHHLPSFQSVSFEFHGSYLNPAFYSDLDKFIEKNKPEVWIHGHTHVSFDYKIADTRILCNPRGYNNGAENPEFNPKLVIEL